MRKFSQTSFSNTFKGMFRVKTWFRFKVTSFVCVLGCVRVCVCVLGFG